MDSIGLEAEVVRLERDRLGWIAGGEALGAEVRHMSLVVRAARAIEAAGNRTPKLLFDLCEAVRELDGQGARAGAKDDT